MAQPSVDEWQRSIGGSSTDSTLRCSESFTGELFIAGTTKSGTIDGISTSENLNNIYISKLTSLGTTVWKKFYGGSADDLLVDVKADNTGGVFLLVSSASADGDFAGAASTGLWLIHLDVSGNQVLKKFLGGSTGDAGSLFITSDNEIYVLGSISVANGTITPIGGSDLWLVHSDINGNIIWQKNYGGTADERPTQVLIENNSLFILGSSNSSTVNSQTNHGNLDVLLLKADTAGVVSKTKLYGGSLIDLAVGMVSGDAGDLLILANSTSNDGDIFTSNGGVDMWVFSVDSTIALSFIYNSNYGGTGDDFGTSILYNEVLSVPILLGHTEDQTLYGSNTINVGTNLIMMQLVAFGGVQWSEYRGGDLNEIGGDLIATADGGILFTGSSSSNNGDLMANAGGSDFWIYKSNYPCPDNLNLDGAVYKRSITRKADNYISTSSKFVGLPSKVTLRSGYIVLEPGFQVDPGVVFQTQIGGCNN